MALLPQSVVDPLADAIFANYKAKFDAEPARGYLGASAIGNPCSRALWYSFRWAAQPEFSGRLYRLFQSGHLQEPRVYADLRTAGVTVYDVNPSTGEQWSFSEPTTAHHFCGNCDGIVTGVPQAPKSPHILEIKTSSDKLFAALQKDGVLKSKPSHFAQMQIYMHWSIAQFGDNGCRRALYVVINKNTDDIYTERLEYSEDIAQALINKAMSIITTGEPPVGISDDPTRFDCKFCDYHALCFGTAAPAATCRSCVHVTPEVIESSHGDWSCAKDGSNFIPLDFQRTGCSSHRVIPIMLKNFATAVDYVDDAVVYQMADGKQFINGDPNIDPLHVSSVEIHAAADKNCLPLQATDKMLVELRTTPGVRVTG